MQLKFQEIMLIDKRGFERPLQMHEGFMLKYNSCHFSPFVVRSQFDKNSLRGHTDLNHGPIGLQPIALHTELYPLRQSQGLATWPEAKETR